MIQNENLKIYRSDPKCTGNSYKILRIFRMNMHNSGQQTNTIETEENPSKPNDIPIFHPTIYKQNCACIFNKHKATFKSQDKLDR